MATNVTPDAYKQNIITEFYKTVAGAALPMKQTAVASILTRIKEDIKKDGGLKQAARDAAEEIAKKFGGIEQSADNESKKAQRDDEDHPVVMSLGPLGSLDAVDVRKQIHAIDAITADNFAGQNARVANLLLAEVNKVAPK